MRDARLLDGFQSVEHVGPHGISGLHVMDDRVCCASPLGDVEHLVAQLAYVHGGGKPGASAVSCPEEAESAGTWKSGYGVGWIRVGCPVLCSFIAKGGIRSPECGASPKGTPLC